MEQPASSSRAAEGKFAWTVCDGRAGLETQVVGLAEAIGLPFEKKTVQPAWPWTMLPVRWWPMPFAALGPGRGAMAPPWPDLVIGCGWRSMPYVMAIKRRSGGRCFTVQLQAPRIPPSCFDAVIAPEHDRLTGPNVLTILGSPNRVSEAILEKARADWRACIEDLPQPRVAVLIGGNSKAYRMSEARLAEIAGELRDLADRGAGLMITTSRRTGDRAVAALKAALEGAKAKIWTGSEGPNPYFGMLAHADAILVTADSTNMITEAGATGKPVHILPLLRGSAKFGRFHESLVERGIARPFTGRIERWTYPPLRETARAAAWVRSRMGLDGRD